MPPKIIEKVVPDRVSSTFPTAHGVFFSATLETIASSTAKAVKVNVIWPEVTTGLTAFL